MYVLLDYFSFLVLIGLASCCTPGDYRRHVRLGSPSDFHCRRTPAALQVACRCLYRYAGRADLNPVEYAGKSAIIFRGIITHHNVLCVGYDPLASADIAAERQTAVMGTEFAP